MIKLKLSSKVLLYFLLVSLLPFMVANYIVVTSANNELLEAASSKQQAVADNLTDRVNNYLETKISNLKYQAQIYSANGQSSNEIDKSLAVMLGQDKDIKNVSVLDVKGSSLIAFDRNGRSAKTIDGSDVTAFKAVNFLAGQNYIGSVNYSDKNSPSITIAVPILSSNYSQHLNDLSQADFGTYKTPDDIKGAVVAQYAITDLWKSVLSAKVGVDGYAYLVDSLGNLVAHPDSKFFTDNQKLSDVQAVKAYIDGKFETSNTVSETGNNVISTSKVVPNSGWGIIVQEPVASIYSGVNSYIKLATVVGLTAIAISILMSIFFGKQLVEPIKKLSIGAKKLGRGEFDQQINLKSKDELQDLAETFNKMGANIKKLIGDLKANNETLQLEETKLNNIISSVSDGVIAVDRDSRIVSINPPAALLTGQPINIDNLLAQPVGKVFSWKQNGIDLQPEIKKPGLYHYSDVTYTHGHHTYYLDLMVSVLDQRNSNVAAIITVHDLTKSRELEFMKLDFVAIAAHELRTPLTVVRGYLDTVTKSVVRKVTILDIENLQKAIVGTNQLRDLINKLLNIAKIERGEMEIFVEKLNILKQVRESVNQHKTPALQKQQHIKFEANTEKPVYVPADPSSLTEVLNNLIGNAIKFTPKGGQINVRVLLGSDNVRVEVSDDGPGIPAELREKLFTKFYRAERSLIAGTRGTGLGLFVSRTIIELQHGQIGLMPEEEGKGSTFYFVLPLYDNSKHDKLISKKQSGEIRGWFKKRSDS